MTTFTTTTRDGVTTEGGTCSAGLPWCRSDWIDVDGSVFHTSEERAVAGGLGSLSWKRIQDPGEPLGTPMFYLSCAEELDLAGTYRLAADLVNALAEVRPEG